MKIDLQKEIEAGLNVEQFNIATKLDEDELQNIANNLFNAYETDLSSRSDWLEKHTRWKKLYLQMDRPINRPWEGSSEESVPILTEACNSFQARAYKAFFPTRNFIEAIPVGRINLQTTERADRVARHMSFQLGIIDKDYKVNKNAMFLSVALNGSDFSKTYYNPILRKNIIERVRAVDLVVPYTMGQVKIEELPRKIHIVYKSQNEVAMLYKSGYFIAKCGDYEVDQGDQYQQAENNAQGIIPAGNDSNEIAKILECHCFLDLDEDKIEEPYIVWLDDSTRKVLRIQIRYEVDTMGQPLEFKKPVEYFTHYKFLENPDGFYGLGMGHLVGSLNTAINKMLRQGIDAATLANTASGFVDERADVKGGEIELSLGKFIKIATDGERIGDNFFQLQFPGPNQGLIALMQALENYARSLASVTEAVTGDVDKVYQPSTLMTMLEQSLQMPTAVMEQLSGSLERELDKIYRLNSKYLDDNEYFVENDSLIPISREDYQEDLRIIPILDPRNITKQQKIAKAQTLYQFILQNPITIQNQQSIYLASRQVLEAMEIENIDDILQPPAPPPEPMRIDDQHQENMYFLMPPQDRPLFDVFPDQDHAQHIAVLDEFLNGPYAQEITKDEMPAVMAHRQKHVAFLYIQSQPQNSEYGQGLAGSMEAQGGDQNGLQALAGAFSPEGQGNALSAGELEGLAGAMAGAGASGENSIRSDTGFLERLLPIQT